MGRMAPWPSSSSPSFPPPSSGPRSGSGSGWRTAERAARRARKSHWSTASEDSSAGCRESGYAYVKPPVRYSARKQGKRRPPLYNAEDYASSLRDWTRRGAWEAVCGAGGEAPRAEGTAPEDEQGERREMVETSSLGGGGREMSLREFSSVSHLLATLAQDLQFALPSFVQEFVGDPLDGATLLLELLRVVQQSRRRGPPAQPPLLPRHAHAVASARASTASSTASSLTSTSALPPRYARRRSSSAAAAAAANSNSASCASSVVGVPSAGAAHAGGAQDERSCLECLRCCVRRAHDAPWRLAESRAGLHTVAIAIMSPSTQTRVAALEVLTKVCELGSRRQRAAVTSSSAHAAVSEALSSTRLSLGEPARFHFLVSMMSSASGAPDLTPAALRFVNAFLEACPGPQERVFAQAELQHAGFSPETITAVMPQVGTVADEVRTELRRWQSGFLDVAALPSRLESAEREAVALREKVALLERKVLILQEEKGVLQSLERCLKERCCHLEDEVNGLRVGEVSGGPKGDGHISPVKGPGALGSDSVETKHHASTPEDEGISSTDNPSSNCSAAEEEDAETGRGSRRGGEEAERIMYETFAVQSETILEGRGRKKGTTMGGRGEAEEEETTIEEVIRELRDLVDDEEAARRDAEARTRAPAAPRTANRGLSEGPTRASITRAQQGRPAPKKQHQQADAVARVQATWSEIGLAEEPEIVPSRILPQPPRRPRSLARAAVKSAAAAAPFFEDESSGQSSDSEEQRPTTAAVPAPVVVAVQQSPARTVVSRGYGGLRRWETVVAGPAEKMQLVKQHHQQNKLQQLSQQQQQNRQPRDSPPKVLRRSESMHHGKVAAMPERWSKMAVAEAAVPAKARHGSRRGSLDDGLFFVTTSVTPPPPRPSPPPPPRAAPPRQMQPHPGQLPFAARARKSRSLDRMDDDAECGGGGGSGNGDWSLGWDFPRGRPPLSRSATRRANPPTSLVRRSGDAVAPDRGPPPQRCPPDGASSGPFGPSYGPQGLYGIIGAAEEMARRGQEARKANRGSSKLYPTRCQPQTAAKVTDLLSGLY